jgi:hypothetical protein
MMRLQTVDVDLVSALQTAIDVHTTRKILSTACVGCDEFVFLSQMRDDYAGSETERDINIKTVSLSFEADSVPVDDESILGSPGLELCKGHTAFQMRLYEEPDAGKMAAADYSLGLGAAETVELETKKSTK